MLRLFTTFAALLSTTVLFVPAALAQEGGEKGAKWIQDFAKAKEQAKAEKKHLLVDFTGSDWCSWCQKLDKEVFDTAPFQAAAPKDFVLVKIDFPQDESLVTKEIKAQNEKLQGEYSIEGFPTILLMDADGHVYAATGYEPGGPEKYLTMLSDKKKKGDVFVAAMTRADAAKGADRAKALAEAIDGLDAEVASAHHLALMEEIVKLDADGKAGCKAKYEGKVTEIAEAKSVQTEMRAMQELLGPLMQNGEGDKALAKLEEIAKAPKNVGQHQAALFFKGMVIMDTSGDTKAALASLDAAKALKPTSAIAKQIDMIVPQIKKAAEKQGGEKGDK